jgi:hypothetical protein
VSTGRGPAPARPAGRDGARNLQDFEDEYDWWVTRTGAGKRPEIKFICSEFAAYCYCWGLLESATRLEGVPSTRRTRARVKSFGRERE